MTVPLSIVTGLLRKRMGVRTGESGLLSAGMGWENGW